MFHLGTELPLLKQPIVKEPGSKLSAEFLVTVLDLSEATTAARKIQDLRLSLLSSKKTAACSVASVGTMIE